MKSLKFQGRSEKGELPLSYCMTYPTILIYPLNLVLRMGVATIPQTAQKRAQGRKIAPAIFTFILSLYFGEKNKPTTYSGGRVSFQSWEVRGVDAIPDFKILSIWIYLK